MDPPFSYLAWWLSACHGECEVAWVRRGDAPDGDEGGVGCGSGSFLRAAKQQSGWTTADGDHKASWAIPCMDKQGMWWPLPRVALLRDSWQDAARAGPSYMHVSESALTSLSRSSHCPKGWQEQS